MSATTLGDVIARLDQIVTQSLAARDRRGYFAALYNRVTMRVRDGIAAGVFEDGPRMERLDVTFASRYLDAYDAYARGQPPSRVWQRAFDATGRDGLFVIHHLLLGMNAHIMLDLGIAAAETAPGPALEGLHGDYDRINDLLASLVPTDEDELVAIAGRWSPPDGALLRLGERLADGAERTAVDTLMRAARGSAWGLATALARLDPSAWGPAIAQQDADAALIGDTVICASPAIDALAGGGSHDVAYNIRVLAQGELGASEPRP